MIIWPIGWKYSFYFSWNMLKLVWNSFIYQEVFGVLSWIMKYGVNMLELGNQCLDT